MSVKHIFDAKHSLLHIYVLLCDYKSLEECLKTGEYNVNNIDYIMSLKDTKPFYGWTPLHVAVSIGDLNSTKLLLKYGADVNARTGAPNWFYFTALHIALKYENQEMCQLLIDSKADINAKDSNKQTPLDLCLHSTNLSSLLIKSGANYKNKELEKYPLIFRAIYKKNICVVELLAKTYKTGIYLKNRSPLEIAIDVYPECVPHLINSETQIHFSNQETGEYPIHLAVRKKNYLWIKMLGEKGVNTNVWNSAGNRPLHVAVQSDCSNEIVLLLLSFGANPNSKNFYGLTPICLAIERGSKELTQLLMRMNTQLSKNLLELKRAFNFKNFKSASVILENCQTIDQSIRFDSQQIIWFFINHCVGELKVDNNDMTAIMQKLIDITTGVNDIHSVWGSLMHFIIYADYCTPTPCFKPLFSTLISSHKCDINYVFKPEDTKHPKTGEDIPAERIMANGTALSFALELNDCGYYAEDLIAMGADHSNIKWEHIFFTPKKMRALKMLVYLGASIPDTFRDDSDPIYMYDETLDADQLEDYSKQFKLFIKWWDKQKDNPLTLKQMARNVIRKSIGSKGCRHLAAHYLQENGPDFGNIPTFLTDYILYKDFEEF